MRIALSLFCCTVATSSAQEPAAPAATLHVPAGNHGVEELLQLVAQAVRRPIQVGEGAAVAGAANLRLQRELVLAGGDWESGLAALLATRQLVLTFDPEGKRYEVMAPPAKMVDWLRARAVPVPVERLASLADLQGPVRVVVPTKVAPAMLQGMLRPYLAGRASRAIACEAEADGIRIVGLAPTVRLALRVLIGFDATLAKVLPQAQAPPWPRAAAGSHRLDAGTYTPVQLVDRLATQLGRNIVVAPAVDALTTEVKLDEAFQGDDLAFEAKVSALLWESRTLVTGLLPKHGLFEAIHLADVRQLPSDRASPMSAAEVLARPELTALVVVLLPTAPLPPTEAVNRIRPLIKGSITAGALGGEALVLQGLSCELVPLLRAVIDQQPKETGK
jgi:hypothetical protein